jgi:glycosyltransferase involved in cell wall biosynthesis
MDRRSKICLIPRLSGIGGMVSFQRKFAARLTSRDFEVSYDLGESNFDAVLIVGGTRQLHQVWRLKRKGIPIVQRLDGMNWVHKVLDTGFRHRVRAEYGNVILSTIRSRLADKIAYQSEFSRKWWEREKGNTSSQIKVIHNAVDLGEFSPGPKRAGENIRILLVEGSLLGGYEFGLENAIQLSSSLAHSHLYDRPVELMVVGKVSPRVKNHWESQLKNLKANNKFRINWMGPVQHEQIADIYRSADIFFSADINAACPNSVIESLACGIPVAAFDTGALAELVGHDGGVTVPYGGDPWQLHTPDIQSLTEGVMQILDHLDSYREAARRRAETAFNLDHMVDKYLELLLG